MCFTYSEALSSRRCRFLFVYYCFFWLSGCAFLQQSQRPPEIRDHVQVVVTFLGFASNNRHFKGINDTLAKAGYTCLEASPQLFSVHKSSFSAHIDITFWKLLGSHIGLSSVKRQAQEARKQVDYALKQQGINPENAEIILLGHSQGGVIVSMFWELFREQYNFRGLITMASPLQGVELLDALCSYEKQWQVAQICGTKQAKFCAATYPLFFKSIKHMLQTICLGRGLIDLAPDSRLVKKDLPRIWSKMAEEKLPVLVITCGSLKSFKSTPLFKVLAPYGDKRRNLISGSSAAEPLLIDGLIATKDQTPSILWNRLRVKEYMAVHGSQCYSRVPGLKKDSLITFHSEALQAVTQFCTETFSTID